MYKDPHKIITQTVPVFFFIWDIKKGKIIYVSPKFYELAADSYLDREAKDLKPFIDLQYLEDYEKFLRSLTAENDYTNRVELKTSPLLKDVKWIEIKTFPVEEEKEKVELIVGHIVDITAKKDRIKDLEGENENFDNIIQLISHDLRQPFTKITLLADLILNEKSVDIENIHKYADKLKEISYSAHELLQNFLQLAVLNYSGEIAITTTEDLNQIVREAVAVFDMEIEAKHLELKVNTPKKESIYPINKSLFSQSIKNLTSNAIKFTPPGGSINIKLTKAKNAYEISVVDSGIGIPKEIQRRLFNEITSVRRPGLQGEPSTGLGLIITKRILELHNGKIHVESKENVGTTFTILLPMKPKRAKR
ncbi:hypothetical protein C900_04872 [Fulvivirga imtechensis AK7]|uniref:histidine kinase n=1 Tax=Fulvivirga imtechensis AK7 TaxID=1237149 RepID=L8JQJ9_9BACT|nr:PAS domain-containing sensor histidine kinase [Fulvivirga imtechensis]ELR69647.1 hypothetical protein C900_04872 [Fulvivirga imtechensis AK7]